MSKRWTKDQGSFVLPHVVVCDDTAQLLEVVHHLATNGARVEAQSLLPSITVLRKNFLLRFLANIRC